MKQEVTPVTQPSSVSLGKEGECYAEVAELDLLRPIASEKQYERVLAAIDELAARTDRSAAEDDYLLMLSWVLEKYESQHYSIDTSEISALEILKDILEESGMTGSDLGRLLGHRELGGKILREKRQLSKKHIQILAKHFKVSPALFLNA